MAVTHNIPLQTMPFIGRADEIVEIGQRLADPACWLLTLVGPGGIGKTRLAIEVANYVAQTQSLVDGIYFVDLQPVSSIGVLVTAIASSLGILMSGSDDPRVQLLHYLTILVTSRQALSLQEEWVWQVGGLQVPDQMQAATIELCSAVQLFVERARRTRQDFTLTGQETFVACISQLTEGMPLALELAGSWIKALSCAEIADEIQRSLQILTTTIRNIPERHRSMQAVFDQSWRRLTEVERQVFVRLSIFKGGFRREAAEQVAGASLPSLSGLVAKSFLHVSTAGRYEIQELIRQYGEEQLDAVPGAKEDAQNCHCVYYAGFLHQRQTTLRGPQQAAALDKIGDELDNLRASWLWAVEHGMRDEIHQSMHSLFVFCHIRGHTVDSEHLLNAAIKRFEQEDSATLAYLLLARTMAAALNGRSVGAEQFSKAIRLAYAFWTEDEIAMPLRAYFDLREEFIVNKLFDDQQQEQVFHHFLTLFRMQNQLWGVAYILYCLGCLYCDYGNIDQAEKLLHESEALFLDIGDGWASCWASMGLAVAFECLGRYTEAHQKWRDHQNRCAEVGDRGATVFVPEMRAQIAWKQRDYYAARFYIAQGIKAHLELSLHLAALDQVFRPLIDVLVSEGRYERAVEVSSFLEQHAATARASRLTNVAHKTLELLAQKLPTDSYEQAVAQGKTLHLRTILEQVFEELSHDSPSAPGIAQIDPLTERELEVLRLTAAGSSNRQIARDLFLSLNTVKSHIHHIYGKLGVATRSEAMARARDLRLF